jgi:hypothetical protein
VVEWLEGFQTDPVPRSQKALTLGVNSHKATQAWNHGIVTSEMTTKLLKESRRSAARAGTW